MIQRIQTLYLFFVVVISIILFFVPILNYVHEGNIVLTVNMLGTLFTESSSTVSISTFPLMVINCMVIILTTIAIFLYKNRALQIKICRINLFLLPAFLIFIVMVSGKIEAQLGTNELGTPFGFGIFLPVISLILTYLAIRGIKKDQELIRSVDRIR